MTRSILKLLVPLLLLAPNVATAAEDGVAALERGAYVEAVQLLEAETTAEPSAAAYYNLGLAYLRTGQRGPAVWAALSSRALGGVDATQSLLTELERAAPPELRPLSASPIALRWRRLATAGPDNTWAIAALALSLVGGLFGAIACARPGSGGRRGAWTALAVCGFVLAAACAALAYTRAALRSATTAAVVADVSLHVAPSARSEVVRSLPAGVVLELGELLEGHYAVTLPTGAAGWVPAGGVRPVLR